jgi:hypothetical protein
MHQGAWTKSNMMPPKRGNKLNPYYTRPRPGNNNKLPILVKKSAPLIDIQNREILPTPENTVQIPKPSMQRRPASAARTRPQLASIPASNVTKIGKLSNRLREVVTASRVPRPAFQPVAVKASNLRRNSQKMVSFSPEVINANINKLPNVAPRKSNNSGWNLEFPKVEKVEPNLLSQFNRNYGTLNRKTSPAIKSVNRVFKPMNTGNILFTDLEEYEKNFNHLNKPQLISTKNTNITSKPNAHAPKPVLNNVSPSNKTNVKNKPLENARANNKQNSTKNTNITSKPNTRTSTSVFNNVSPSNETNVKNKPLENARANNKQNSTQVKRNADKFKVFTDILGIENNDKEAIEIWESSIPPNKLDPIAYSIYKYANYILNYKCGTVPDTFRLGLLPISAIQSFMYDTSDPLKDLVKFLKKHFPRMQDDKVTSYLKVALNALHESPNVERAKLREESRKLQYP